MNTKTLIGMVVLMGVGGLAVYNANLGNQTSYTATSTAPTVEVVEPEWATDEDAVEAAKAVIRKKELEAELESLSVEIESLESRKAEIERELDLY